MSPEGLRRETLSVNPTWTTRAAEKRPSRVATEMVVAPARSPVTRPPVDTLATLESDDVQLRLVSVASEGRILARSVVVAPMGRMRVESGSDNPVTGVTTVTLALPE